MPDRMALAVWLAGSLWLAPAATAQTRTESAADPQQISAPESARPVDSRTQYPAFLSNSYVGFDVGSINYAFSSEQLEPGFRAESVSVPHAAARIILYGHQFGRFVSAQAGYTRPGRWVTYNHLNGTDITRTVWMAVGDVSLKSQLPLSRRVSLFGQFGLAVVNRMGIKIDGADAVSHVNFAAPIYGAGVELHANPRWDAILGATYVPANPERKQPAISFGSLGFRYNMHPLPVERVEAARTPYIFPANLVQFAFVTNAMGYGANDAVSKTVPIFWGGNVHIARGGVVRYQRNVFHTRSRLAVDIGTSVSLLTTRDRGETFAAAAIYPVLRWMFLRTSAADVYLSWSIAGPAYLSKRVIDGEDTGNRFTFHDVLGFGMFVNKRRNTFIQIDVGHYSNGNLFASNPGVKLPTTIAIGRGF